MPSNQPTLSSNTSTSNDVHYLDFPRSVASSPSHQMKKKTTTTLQQQEDPSCNGDDGTWSEEVGSSNNKTSIFLPVSSRTTEHLLHFYLQDSEYGEISSVQIRRTTKKHKNSSSSSSKKGKDGSRIAIVTFRWHEDAADAIDGLKGIVFNGMELHPQWSLPLAQEQVRAEVDAVQMVPRVVPSHDVAVVPSGSSSSNGNQHRGCPYSKKRRPEANKHISSNKRSSKPLLSSKKFKKLKLKIAPQSKQKATSYKRLGNVVY